MPPTTLAQASSMVRGALANCGGFNARRSRFAGTLAEKTPSERELLGILHALILRNGVRKTTAPGRNADLVENLVTTGRLGGPRRWRVVEIGASAGFDALSTRPVLERFGGVERYVLADACPHVLYDAERGLVFDEDGELLQVRVPGGFVSMNFSYNFGFQRWTTLPARIPPYLLRRSGLRLDRSRAVRVPLVHPQIRLEPGSPFDVRRVDVFDPDLLAALGGERFDLVICLHLLVPRYFDDPTIERGVANLRRLLAPSGRLIVGANESFRVLDEDGAARAEGDSPC